MEYYQLNKTSFPIHSNQILVFGKNIILFWCGCFGIFCLSVCPFVCLSVNDLCLCVGLTVSTWYEIKCVTGFSRIVKESCVFTNLSHFQEILECCHCHIFNYIHAKQVPDDSLKACEIAFNNNKSNESYLDYIGSNWKAKEREFAEKLA